jgi:hypothetical protein
MTSIDFDAASAAWMANKIRRGPALLYKCTAIQKNGSACSRAAKSECVPYKPHLCTQHSKNWTSVSSASASPSEQPIPCIVVKEVEKEEEIKPKKRLPVFLKRNLRRAS